MTTVRCADRVSIGPAQIDVVTIDDAARRIIDRARLGQGGYVMTHNLEHLWLREHDHDFDRRSSGADLVVADGMPLVLVSRIQGTPLPERVGGIDLFERLIAEAAAHDLSVYLVGGTDDTAVEAARRLTERHPQLRVAGAHAPADHLASRPDALAGEVQRVTDARPDLVFIGLPSQLQATMAAQFRRTLPHAWVQGVGVSFSFVTGEVHRAPVWVQRIGFEWLHRVLQQPSLTGRYFLRCVPLGLRLVTRATRDRLRRAVASSTGRTRR